MKSLHRWAWFIGCVLLLSGCKTISTAVDKVGAVGHALVDTTQIIKAASDDVESVWVEAGIVKGDKDAPPAPAPDGK